MNCATHFLHINHLINTYYLIEILLFHYFMTLISRKRKQLSGIQKCHKNLTKKDQYSAFLKFK